MGIRSIRAGAISMLVGCSALLAWPAGAGVVGVGVLSQNGYSHAHDISADGTVVTGVAFTPSGERAFRWTAAGGIVNLGLLSGTQGSSIGEALDATGTVVVGSSATTATFPLQTGYRWTQAGGMVGVGLLRARDVSADGNTIVGYDSTGQPARWTSGGGVQGLVGLPGGSTVVVAEANVISGDATTVAGFTPFATGVTRPWTWTQSGGVQPLPLLNNFGSAFPEGMSQDGSVIAGRALVGTEHPVRWTSAGIQSLGFLPGGTLARANAISGDGLTIGGRGDSPDGNQRAFIWTAALGMQDLNLFLPTIGISVAGWTLNEVTGISTDGSTLTGTGMHEYQPGISRVEGFVITIPEPAAFSVLLAGMVLLHRRPTSAGGGRER